MKTILYVCFLALAALSPVMGSSKSEKFEALGVLEVDETNACNDKEWNKVESAARFFTEYFQTLNDDKRNLRRRKRSRGCNPNCYGLRQWCKKFSKQSHCALKYPSCEGCRRLDETGEEDRPAELSPQEAIDDENVATKLLDENVHQRDLPKGIAHESIGVEIPYDDILKLYFEEKLTECEAIIDLVQRYWTSFLESGNEKEWISFECFEALTLGLEYHCLGLSKDGKSFVEI